MKTKNDKVILIESRGDYITAINWQRDGRAEVRGGDISDAIRYTDAEAEGLIVALGRGYSVEEAQ